MRFKAHEARMEGLMGAMGIADGEKGADGGIGDDPREVSRMHG